MLSFNNHKIVMTGKLYGYKPASFDLLAGHNCPAASLCHSRVNVVDGKRVIEDLGQFRCYAVKAEAAYTSVYNLRANNRLASELPSFVDDISQEITDKRRDLIRIHSSGDFYDFSYFQKWVQVAKNLPDVTFFGYTKQASFISWLLKHPLENLKIQYSYGGLHDKYALKNDLPSCTVVTDDFIVGRRKFYNPYKKSWEVISCAHENPCDDFLYIMKGVSFGILFH